MEQESGLKEIEKDKERSLNAKSIQNKGSSFIPGIGQENTKGNSSAISIIKCVDGNDPINLALQSFLKECNVNKSAETQTRKINSSSYLIICATKNEAKKLISCESKKFKLRLLSESSPEIK